MHKSHSINSDSSPKLSLSLPLLADTDSSSVITDADNIRTGVTSARWWILFQYSSALLIAFLQMLASAQLIILVSGIACSRLIKAGSGTSLGRFIPHTRLCKSLLQPAVTASDPPLLFHLSLQS